MRLRSWRPGLPSQSITQMKASPSVVRVAVVLCLSMKATVADMHAWMEFLNAVLLIFE